MTGYGLDYIGFIFEYFEDALGKFAVVNCVGIIEVVVCRSLLINIKPFYVVEVDAFLLKL